MKRTEDTFLMSAFVNVREARVKSAARPANALITGLLVRFGPSTLKLR